MALPDISRVWINVYVENSGSNSIVAPKVELWGKAETLARFKMPFEDNVIGTIASLSGKSSFSSSTNIGNAAVSFALTNPPPIVSLKFSATTMPASFNSSKIYATACWR